MQLCVRDWVIDLSDRFGQNSDKELNDKQQKFLTKLQNLSKIKPDKPKTAKDKKVQAASMLAIRLLDLLPDSPVCAVIIAQIYEASQDTIQQIWDLFGQNE